MSCVSVLGAFYVSTASTASGSGLTPCMSTILPRFLIESLRISHFDGLHFKPALFCQDGCCHDHVVHVAQHEIPVFLGYPGQSLSHQSLKGRRSIALTERHPIPLKKKPNSHANPVLSLSLFRRGTCQKAEPRCSIVKNLASPSFERLLSMRSDLKLSLVT